MAVVCYYSLQILIFVDFQQVNKKLTIKNVFLWFFLHI